MFSSIKDANEFVYHYTSREVALEYILNSGKIRLNTFSSLNDPRESKDWNFNLRTHNDISNDTFFNIQKEGTEYAKNSCKVLCMVRDNSDVLLDGIDATFHRGFARPSMWANYSDNHKGICFIFNRQALEDSIKNELSDKGNIYFGEVEYANYHNDDIDIFDLDYETILNNSLETVIQSKVDKHYKSYYFRKAKDWSNENEWRCVLRGKHAKPEYVSIANSICGIVLGSDFSKVYIPSLIPLRDKYSISLSQIQWSNGKPEILPIDEI